MSKTTFKKEGFVLTHGLRVQTTMVWKTWREECEVTLHLKSGIRER